MHLSKGARSTGSRLERGSRLVASRTVGGFGVGIPRAGVPKCWQAKHGKNDKSTPFCPYTLHHKLSRFGGGPKPKKTTSLPSLENKAEDCTPKATYGFPLPLLAPLPQIPERRILACLQNSLPEGPSHTARSKFRNSLMSCVDSRRLYCRSIF